MGLPVLAIGSDLAWLARLQRMLALRGDLHWRGTFASDALRSGRCSPAAVWLVDGDDPVVVRACSRIRSAEPIRLHFYRHPNLAALRHCTQVGARGCLDKQAPPDVVQRAIRAVGIGVFALDPSLLIDALATPAAPSVAAPPSAAAALASDRWPQMTGRQREIVHCAAQGLSNKQIGRHLGISPETVKTHLHQAFERAGLSGRGALREVPQAAATACRAPG